MNPVNYLLKCSRCNRKILVATFLNGSNHNTMVTATCAECLRDKIDAKYAEDNPEEADRIDEWITEGV